jgi:hypothetical protein
MAIVQLNLSYETVIDLVEQLPFEEQKTLLFHLLGKAKNHRLDKDERKKLFHSMVVDLGKVSPAYSERREDWYGEDGR